MTDLIQAEKDIKKAIEEKKKNEKKKFIDEFKVKAASLGIPLDQIIKDLNGNKTATVPKYRNPENSNKTWTGKGRRPGWYKKCIENGINEADLLI